MERAVKVLIRVVVNIGITLSAVLFPRGVCRYSPTCSHYARNAIETFAPHRAILLIAGRLMRCNPFFRGGYDPLPRNE